MNTSPDGVLPVVHAETASDRIFNVVQAIREGRQAESLALEVGPTEFLTERSPQQLFVSGDVDLEELAERFLPKP